MLLAIHYAFPYVVSIDPETGAQTMGSADVVLGAHREENAPPLSAYPDAVVLSWDGDLDKLPKLGPALPGLDPAHDGRLSLAPPFPSVAKAYAAARRYKAEVGGFSFNGHRIASDREAAQPKIEGLSARALRNPAYTVADFKVADGSFISLSNADCVALGDALDAHIQACMSAESAALKGIADGSLATPAAVDALFAPLGH